MRFGFGGLASAGAAFLIGVTTEAVCFRAAPGPDGPVVQFGGRLCCDSAPLGWILKEEVSVFLSVDPAHWRRMSVTVLTNMIQPAYLIICSYRVFKKSPVPNPSKYFGTLQSLYEGNLKVGYLFIYSLFYISNMLALAGPKSALETCCPRGKINTVSSSSLED